MMKAGRCAQTPRHYKPRTGAARQNVSRQHGFAAGFGRAQ